MINFQIRSKNFLIPKLRILLLILTLCNLFSVPVFSDQNPTEKKFKTAGLIDIQRVNPTIQVDLVNSNPDNNFFRKNFYQGLNRAYLRHSVAVKLSKAQKILKSLHPDFSLLIMDAARPRSISQAMYDTVRGTKFENFVAKPKTGSMHNFGIAVDLTIVDQDNKRIDMGFTPFYKSNFQIYYQYLKKKIGIGLTREQKLNRELLKNVMKKAGFFPLSFEWWHFNGISKIKARKMFKIIE